MPKTNVYSKKVREKVLASIKEYYNSNIVSERIRNEEVNTNLYNRITKFYEPDVEKRVKETYEKYSIARYRNKKEFMNCNCVLIVNR